MKKRPCLSVRLLAALLAAGCTASSLEDAEDFVLSHDEIFLTVNLDLRAAVLAESNPVAWLNVQRLTRPVVLVFAFTCCDYFSFLRLFLGGIRNDDFTTDLLTLFDSTYDHAVMKRRNFRCHTLVLLSISLTEFVELVLRQKPSGMVF